MIQVEGQLSLWDYMIPNRWQDMPVSDVIDRIGEMLEISFTWCERFEEYQAKVGKVNIQCSIDRYDTGDSMDGQEFIACGAEHQNRKQGCGAPADSIEGAVEWFRIAISRLNK